MTEHNWEVYADSSGEPIQSKKNNPINSNSNLKHIYSNGREPGNRMQIQEDFNVGTWLVKCKACGYKAEMINGKPILWGKLLDCDYTFAIFGIEIIMNS